MKFSKWIIGTALLFSAQIAYTEGGAYDPCGPCGPCGPCKPCDPCYENPCDLCNMDWCDMEYDFYVDALYWRFCRSGLDFFDEEEDCHHLDHNWRWGYRIGAYARYRCWDVGLRYTSFCFDEKRRFRGILGESDLIESGRRGARHEFDYDVLDIEVGYSCCLCGGLTFRPIAGARLAWIDEKFKIRDFEFDDERLKFDFYGYGLYLGFTGRWELMSYCLCERNIPIALVTRWSTGVLHGDFDFHFDDNEMSILYDRKGECLFIPTHDLYLGLDLTFCDLCGMNAFFQVGYEVQHWGNWKDFLAYDRQTEWGFGGLVLRFGASF